MPVDDLGRKPSIPSTAQARPTESSVTELFIHTIIEMQFEGRPHYHCLESSILTTKAPLEGYNYTPFKWICSYLDLVGFEATEIHIFLCTLWQGEEQVEVSGRGFCKEYHLKWGG
jgi:hypothetical protein